ncbi:MAG: metallophosphoesterase [Motilibacteraceae bacterium]
MEKQVEQVAVFGDLGGHQQVFAGHLRALGVDPDTGQIPPDLRLVLVGDLVHRGPDSPGVLRCVDRLLRAHPDRCVVLIGNHERQYLPDQTVMFEWPEHVDQQVLDETLLRWWGEGLLRLAHAERTGGIPLRRGDGTTDRVGAGEILISHAGLTRGLWSWLGQPVTAHEAAVLLNAGLPDQAHPAWNPGAMITGEPSALAGVTWAGTFELYLPWFQHPDAPFHQAHGHAAIYDARRQQWVKVLQALRRSEDLRALIHHNGVTGVTAVEIPDSRVLADDLAGEGGEVLPGADGGRAVIFGVDPGHAKYPARVSGPLALPVTDQGADQVA